MVRTHCWQVLVGQISVWQQQAADGLWEEGQRERGIFTEPCPADNCEAEATIIMESGHQDT